MSSSNHGDNAIAEEFQHWQLPDVTEPEHEKINVFGRTQVISEIEEEEEERFSPPTLAEIESLQQQAEQEAREQGQQQGYEEGFEKGRLEGLTKGHEQGFEQGKQQGVEEGLAEAKILLERLEILVKKIEQPLSVVDTQVEASLLMLSSSLAKAIVGNDIQTHPEHIHSVIRQGIEALPIKNQPVNIRLNPEDIYLVEQAYNATDLDKKQWKLESDPSLSLGDCIIESHKSEVDLRVKSRTESVLMALTEQQYQLEKQLQQALQIETQLAAFPRSQELQTVNQNEHITHADIAE